MMLKPDEDDGYCSRSSLDSPTQIIKGEMTNSNATEGFNNNNKESKINQVTSSLSYSSSAPSFLEVMLMRDDWKKVKDLGGVLSKNVDNGVSSTGISQDKLFISNRGEVINGSGGMRQQDAVEKIREREFQPRKLIKLMPSSSQNMLFFTKQSALSGLVVSTKSNLTSGSMTFQSLIKNNNHNAGISHLNSSQQVVVKNSNITLPVSSNLNKQSIRLTAAEVLKSKINHNSVEISNKVQSTQIGSNKKVTKELNSLTSSNNNTFTSARTGQPYIRGSRGWGSRAKSCFYAGRQELHPVIDHDYCEFSAFNAEIQSGIILMSSETCARTDRLNLKRNKANGSQPAVQTIPPKSNNSILRNREASPLHVHRAPGNHLQQINVDSKKKCLKRKMNDPFDVSLPAQPAKNSVGRPRLSSKFEKSHQVLFPKKTSTGGYDSSEDFMSPPLTDDKNYVKIPGSFQNDFVYFATTRGRSSRKRNSDKLTSQMTTPADQQHQPLHTSGSHSSGIKAFEWYKEMAQTDKSSRFGNAHQIEAGQVEMGSYLCSAEEDGKTLISESEVADLVMQLLPSSEDSKDDQDLGLGSSNNDVMTSDDILTSNDGHNLMEHFIDINNIDLNVISGEFGGGLSPIHYLKHLDDQKHDSVQDHQNFHPLDFPLITSTAQLLDDINDNDLLITSELASMNALLKELSDDHMGVCDSADVLSHMPGVDASSINDDAMVMCLLDSTDNKLLSGNECDVKIENNNLRVEEVRPLTPISPECLALPSNLADDFQTFNFNPENKVFGVKDVCVGKPMEQSVDFPSLLTPPPSLPPSAAPPELITVNMFWNDLPGLLIENREYVRLVDIHKQIMPAKDTGILKKRCAMLNLQVSFCSEMQRDFLIRYMNATKSKSRVIVTKNTALALISFYVSPRMKALVAENGELDHHHTLEECLENGMRAEGGINQSVLNSGSRKAAPDLHILQVAPENIPQDPAKDAGMTSERSQKSIKRSPRLVHKRFSYLDLINNGFSSSSSSNLNARNASAKKIKSNSRDSPNINTQSKYQPLVSALKAKLSHKNRRNTNMYPQRNESVVYRRKRQLIGIGQGRNNLKKLTFKSNSFLSLRGSLHYRRQQVEETSTLSEEPIQSRPSSSNVYAAEHCYAAYPSSFHASPVDENKSFPDESEADISEVSSHFSHEEIQALKSTSEEDCEGSMTANESDPSETYLDASIGECKSDFSDVAYFPGNFNLQQEADDKVQQPEPVCDHIHVSIDNAVENVHDSKPNPKSSNFPVLQKPGSDRVLRSSTSAMDSKNTILSTKNRQNKSLEMSLNRNYHSTSFYSLRRSHKLDDEVSNENRSPRMIRNKKRILKMFHAQSILKRPLAKSTSPKTVTHEYKSHLATHALVKKNNVVKNGGAGSQQSQLQARPHRLARKKFDVLKF